MKRALISSLPVKVAALFLTVLLVLTCVLLVACPAAAMVFAGSQGTTEAAREAVAETVLNRYALDMASNIVWSMPLDEYEEMPFTYTATDDTGAVLINTYQDTPYLAKSTATYMYDYYPFPGSNTSVLRQVSVTLYADVDQSGEGWLPLAVRAVSLCHENRWWMLALGGMAFVLAAATAVFLHAAAGWQPGKEEPVCNPFDRIPFDIYTGLYVALAVAELVLLRELSFHYLPFRIVTAFLFILDVFLCLGYTMSIATRLKTHTLWRNTLIGRLLGLLGRGFRAAGRHLPLVAKTLLVLGALSAVELLLYFSCYWEPAAVLVWWGVGKLVEIPLVVLIMLGLGRLKNGIRRVAAGQVEHQISTQYLPGDLRRAAEDVNHIGDGLSEALEARLQSERFKTELITNVSHDIKTPLTSIINYVDLMEKQRPEDPVLQEYLEVLHRQSARLKKLIEDLIEASKASTGNLPVELTPVQLGVLLEQTVGEYAEKAEAGGLTLILHQPEQPVMVLADGRHLWRVLDNLMNNICKYAMEGTRVYLDLEQRGDTACILFRNISRVPLTLSNEELTERFVRGDSSRNTEGSGLGLSIARSLMELQGGSLEATVDGDLFKVELKMHIVAKAE
ncbi:MAG: HAMP domain-containing histidine kinase [Clostridia bacterium]|nr:HAMP domain-containing histidine kinase [Clostridia bacterium]